MYTDAPKVGYLAPIRGVLGYLSREAWDLFFDGKIEEAIELCHEILRRNRAGRLQRAGAHIILAHGLEGDYLWHATQAVETFEDRYDEPEHLRANDEFIKAARLLQEDAFTYKGKKERVQQWIDSLEWPCASDDQNGST